MKHAPPEVQDVLQLQEAHEALMQFVYQAPIGLVEARLDGEVTLINPMSAQLLMPLSAAGDLGNLFDVLRDVAPQLPALAAAAPWPGGEVCNDLRVPLPATPGDDDEVPPTLSLRVVRLNAHALMCSVSDITATLRLQRRHVAAELRDATRTDPLTGLPNRRAALERIEAALSVARGQPDQRFAVLFINSDGFNRVNVNLGPAVGDALLRLMGTRISGSLRQRRAPEGPAATLRMAARLGVDEFVVVLGGLGGDRGPETADTVARRLVDVLREPYTINQVAVHCTASIGVALEGGSADNAEAVLQNASLAMREAKRRGGAHHQQFEPRMKERAKARASVEADLRLALQQGQLFVVFQPITHLPGTEAGTGTSVGVAGVEALVRWRHPVRGLVSPIEFIGIAEECGLIVPLGAYVLDAACAQLAAWQQTLGAGAPQVLSVNLSRAQLTEAGLVADVAATLQRHGLAPASLQLEITESLAAENPAIQARLHELKALGLTLALDDFGTGYSSLASLHLWPVDVIKIDRSFVSQLATSAHHRVLVQATVMVARSLGMRTVAEGVETAEQAQLLLQLQCDKAQGYFYARPLEGTEASAWLAARAGTGTGTGTD